MGGAVFLLGGQLNEIPGEPWSYSRTVDVPQSRS